MTTLKEIDWLWVFILSFVIVFLNQRLWVYPTQVCYDDAERFYAEENSKINTLIHWSEKSREMAKAHNLDDYDRMVDHCEEVEIKYSEEVR
jgi:hypothetical protein